MRKPFAGAYAKTLRARQHIDETEREAAQLHHNPLFKVVAEPSPLSPLLLNLVAHELREMPDSLAASLGDAVHNLRSALDLMASDLVRLNGNDPRNVHFPFVQDPNDLESEIRRKRFHLAAPDVVDMVRALKPFRGGNTDLRGLHDLDLVDKHQLLIPLTGIGGLPVLSHNWVTGVHFRHTAPWGDPIPLREGGVMLVMQRGRGVEIGQSLPLDAQLAFGPETPFPNAPVFVKLKALAQLVDGIVQSFGAHCLGRRAP